MSTAKPPAGASGRISTESTDAPSMPWLLRVSPAVAGLATAAVVLLLAAGPLSPKGDMTVTSASLPLLKEPKAGAEACGDAVPRGWLLFCLTDAERHCTSRIAETELWVQTSQHCWVPASAVRFEVPTLEFTDPPTTFAGDDLPVVARNAWDERRRAKERAALDELQSLFDQQRWRDLESRAKVLVAAGTVYLEEGRKVADLRIGDALSAQLEHHIADVEPRLSALELDIESMEGVFMKPADQVQQNLALQSKALELKGEVDKFVEGLTSWKELTGLVEFQFRASRERLLGVHHRILLSLAALAVRRYAKELTTGTPSAVLQYEGDDVTPPTLCRTCGLAGAREFRDKQKTFQARLADRQKTLQAWRQQTVGCAFPVESAGWEADDLIAAVVPTRAGSPIIAKAQTLRFKWDGPVRGLVPRERWNGLETPPAGQTVPK